MQDTQESEHEEYLNQFEEREEREKALQGIENIRILFDSPEYKAQTLSLAKSMQTFQGGFENSLSQVSKLFTPEMVQNINDFSQMMQEKASETTSMYNNSIHDGMKYEYKFDFPLEKEEREELKLFFFVVGKKAEQNRNNGIYQSNYDEINSITKSEMRKWCAEFYLDARKKLLYPKESEQKVYVLLPAPATGAEGIGNKRGEYKSEGDKMEELSKFKKAVIDICLEIKGFSNDKIPSIATIKMDALRNSGLSERVVTLNIKNSTTLDKTGLKNETTIGHIHQIVGHFFKDNRLILNILKVNV